MNGYTKKYENRRVSYIHILYVQDVNDNFTVVCFQNTLYVKDLIKKAGFYDYLNKTIIVM